MNSSERAFENRPASAVASSAAAGGANVMGLPQAEIVVSKDGMEVIRKAIAPGEYILGRDPNADICVEVDLVSRRHARLTIKDDEAHIEDLGSANGTFVEGWPVTGLVRFWPNQKIQIGNATVEVRRVTTAPMSIAPAEPGPAVPCYIRPEDFLQKEKYNVGGMIALGGMGTILEAREANIERKVAMKVMREKSSPNDLVRFVAEAKVTGQLEHPNIVPVHELSVDANGKVFYTMKFVRGITLQKVLDLMAEGTDATIKKYSLGLLLTVFQKVCDAVAFAHSKGVIHRDLKPENIMVGDFGEVLVMDWGLAKVHGQPDPASAVTAEMTRSFVRSVPEFAGVTMAGTILGTPRYMSPEQARGEVETLDARTDIYSLGAILYYLLALRPPVEDDDGSQVVRRVACGEFDPLPLSKSVRLRHLTGGRIPDSLAAVVRQAMAFQLADRYASVEELQAEITAYQNGFATQAERAGFAKHFLLLIYRHKAAFSTALAAWFIITALVAWFVIGVRASERRATRNAEIAAANEQKAVEQKENTRRALAKSQIALAEAAFHDKDGPAMQDALNSVPEDLHDSNWNYLIEKADTSIAGLRMSKSSEIWAAAAHPKKAGIFAVVDYNSNVALVEAATGARLLEFQGAFAKKNKVPNAIALSPDGERIALGQSDSGVVIHSSRDGSKLLDWEAPGTTQLQFSPDGRGLLQVCNETLQINLWDAATGQLLWTNQAGGYLKAVFDPGGQAIAVYSDKQRFRLLSAKDGSLIRQLPNPRNHITSIAIHPDGKRMVTSDVHGYVRGWDLQDDRTLFEIRANDREVRAVAFSRDGTRFVTLANFPNGKQSIQVWDAEIGDHLQTLLGGSGDAFGLSVHPISGELVVPGRTTKVWSLPYTPAKWKLTRGKANDIAFWGSDDLILGPVPDGYTGLLDLAAGNSTAPRVLWQPDSIQYFDATASGDGRFAALGKLKSTGVSEFQFIRNEGHAATIVNTFQLNGQVRIIRLNGAGDRLAALPLGVVVEPATGLELARLDLQGQRQVNDVRWIGGGKRLVGLITARQSRGIRGAEEQIVLWDAATGQRLQTVTNATATDCLAVSPDGKLIAEAGADKMLRLRDADTLAVKQEFRAHDGAISALAFHPTQPILATGSEDLTIKMWNVATGQRLRELSGADAEIRELAFSPSGKRLACWTINRHAFIWEP